MSQLILNFSFLCLIVHFNILQIADDIRDKILSRKYQLVAIDSMYINDEFMGEMMTTYIHREEKKKLVCQRPNIFIYSSRLVGTEPAELNASLTIKI